MYHSHRPNWTTLNYFNDTMAFINVRFPIMRLKFCLSIYLSIYLWMNDLFDEERESDRDLPSALFTPQCLQLLGPGQVRPKLGAQNTVWISKGGRELSRWCVICHLLAQRVWWVGSGCSEVGCGHSKWGLGCSTTHLLLILKK